MAKRRQTPRKSRIIGVEVEAELRDEIDYDRFAWALLQYCRLKLEEKDGGQP